jgi:RNA polymerase sigma-70 factor (ECF subfamily)
MGIWTRSDTIPANQRDEAPEARVVARSPLAVFELGKRRMKQHSIHRTTEHAGDKSSAFSLDASVLEAVQRLRAGVETDESFNTIERWLRHRLIGYFRAHYFSPEDADDLVQKTLARVYLGIRQLEHEEKFLAWLFVIARNVRCTAVEQQQRERQLMAGGIELVEGVPDPRPATCLVDLELDQKRIEEVRAAIEELPAQQRQCLLLRVRDELSYSEIATLLRLSVNTVRNHLAEAKKNLRRLLSEEIEGAF